MIVRTVFSSVALVALSHGLPMGGPVQGKAIPFEELGQEFVEENCPEGAEPAICSLEDVIASRYATVRMGAFDLSFPLTFFGGKRNAEIGVVVTAVLELQDEWFQWFAKDASTVKAAQREIEILTGWVDSWKRGKLKKIGKGEGGNLLDLLEASEDVRKASAKLAPMIFDAESMMATPQFVDRLHMLFCPTRKNFIQMVGYGGLISPALRESAWHPGTAEWTQFWIEQTMVVALEYSPWTDDPKFKLGLSMNKFDKEGQRQHVVQQAAAALLTKTLNRLDVPLLDKGLAVDMTVAVCGRANTIDGEGAISSTGASTAPYERFVPGGNPNGGVLPPIPAIGFSTIQGSHWRKSKGGDLYAGALRAGQKQGGKHAKKDKKRPLYRDAAAHFELTSPAGKHMAVTAPFLGQAATQRPYPEDEYLNDYREFFRSYQACFLGWLREAGSEGDKPEDAETKFQQLVSKLSLEKDTSLDSAVQETYGEPLSTVDGSAGLEWRFLRWLEKQ